MVVPVRDGAADIERCLAALARSASAPLEILVVDDGSADDSAARAAAAGVRVLSSSGRGPAAARNLGGRAARGDWLFFLDADCLVHAETLTRLEQAVAAAPEASAVFGSYDDRPEAPGLVSQYRNLLHCFTHRTGRAEASTFWSGCGAVRRDAFEALGGFDERRFPGLGMEDIDLGYRLRAAGHRIRLDPRIEVTHRKRWTLASMVRADLLERGVPWTLLWLERGRVPADLAIGWRHRIGAGAAVALSGAPGLALLSAPAATVVGVAALGLFLAANLDFARFLARRRGVAFAIAALPPHFLHALTAALAFTVGVLRHGARGARPAAIVSAPRREPRAGAGRGPSPPSP